MKIGIIGAGAAGMMAAATIVEQYPGHKVVLIEKNALLGRKVIISGGGRCNVTTGVQDVRTVLTKYMRGSKFLTSAMYNFPPEQVYQWFKNHGVPLKTEDDMRVFPQSNNGKDVVGVFDNIFEEHNVDVRKGESVTSVNKMAKKFQLTLKDGKSIDVDALILTTGGQAYRYTGSTGDGYQFAEALGHSITDLAASLNSFLLQEQWPKELSGVSFDHIKMSIPSNKKYVATGPIVFTHKGISGPAVFALSAQIAFEQYSKDTPLEMHIDFVPDSSIQDVRKILDDKIRNQPKQLLFNLLRIWLPKSVLSELLKECAISSDIVNASVSNDMRKAITSWLKECSVRIIGRGSGSEFVTAGGVDTNEIDSGTMGSKICPGLYFAGEIMNIDGVTGGFNLQAAWATGNLAGASAAEGSR